MQWALFIFTCIICFYILIGVVVANWATEVKYWQIENSQPMVKFTWAVGQLVVIVCWLPLTCIGIIKGISENAFR